MKIQKNKIVVAMAISTLFAYTTLANAGLFDKQPKPVVVTEASDKEQNFNEAFTPEGMFAKKPEKVSAGAKKIVIAGFQLEFSTEQKGISEGGGSAAGLASTTEKVYTLKGVTDSQFQAVTEKAYERLVKKLGEMGYEVLPSSTLLETGYKEKFAKVNQPPVHHERGVASAILFGSLAKIGEDKDEKGQEDNASVIATAKDTSPDVYSKFMLGGPGFKAADTLQANILQLRLKVNFARFDGGGAWVFTQVDDKPQNGIGVKGTGMQIFSPNGKMETYQLAKSLILPNRLAEMVKPVSASASQTTERAAGGTLRALAGLATGDVASLAGGVTGAAHSTMASDNFELVAGSNYEDITLKDLDLALNVVLQAFPKAK